MARNVGEALPRQHHVECAVIAEPEREHRIVEGKPAVVRAQAPPVDDDGGTGGVEDDARVGADGDGEDRRGRAKARPIRLREPRALAVEERDAEAEDVRDVKAEEVENGGSDVEVGAGVVDRPGRDPGRPDDEAKATRRVVDSVGDGIGEREVIRHERHHERGVAAPRLGDEAGDQPIGAAEDEARAPEHGHAAAAWGGAVARKVVCIDGHHDERERRVAGRKLGEIVEGERENVVVVEAPRPAVVRIGEPAAKRRPALRFGEPVRREEGALAGEIEGRTDEETGAIARADEDVAETGVAGETAAERRR